MFVPASGNCWKKVSDSSPKCWTEMPRIAEVVAWRRRAVNGYSGRRRRFVNRSGAVSVSDRLVRILIGVTIAAPIRSSQ